MPFLDEWDREAAGFLERRNPICSIADSLRVMPRGAHSGERNARAPRAPRAKTIVGIVGNVKYSGLDEETPAEIYLPYDQEPVDAFTVTCAAPETR